MKLNTISIKHFIGDLPRLLNENFKAIADTIIAVYNEEEHILGNDQTSIVCKTLDAKDNITTTKDVKILLANGKVVSLLDIYNKIADEETDSVIASRGKLQKKNLK